MAEIMAKRSEELVAILLHNPIFRDIHRNETLEGALQQFIDFSIQRRKNTISQTLKNAYWRLIDIAYSLQYRKRYNRDTTDAKPKMRWDPETKVEYIDVGGGAAEGGYSIKVDSGENEPVYSSHRD